MINGYPFEESIRSILPIVDEFICVIGEGVDDTRGRVVAIGDPKIRVIDFSGTRACRIVGSFMASKK